jgi:hypothetical protein
MNSKHPLRIFGSQRAQFALRLRTRTDKDKAENKIKWRWFDWIEKKVG